MATHGSTRPHSEKAQKNRFAFSAYCVLFATVFINIQLFLCGLYALRLSSYVNEGKWLLGIGVGVMVLNIFYFMRLKRQHVELYYEEAQLLYIGTILCLPVLQWLCHYYLYLNIFEIFGPYAYVEWLLMAVWMCVLLFNLITEVSCYKRRSNRRHWSVQLWHFFRFREIYSKKNRR